MENKTFCIWGMIFLLACSCKNQSSKLKNIDVYEKNSLVIVCDSINLNTELMSFNVFFHIINYSNKDIVLPTGNQSSHKYGFLFITPSRDDSVSIFSENGWLLRIRKRSILYFTQMIFKDKFRTAYNSSNQNLSFVRFMQKYVEGSKMIYVPDPILAQLVIIQPFNYGADYVPLDNIVIMKKEMAVRWNPPTRRQTDTIIEKKIE